MRRYVSLRLKGLLLAGTVLLLAWNSLTSPVLAFIVRHAHERQVALRNAWLIGWLVMLAGGVLMLVHATRVPTGGAKPADRDIPFLRTPGMAWVFASILLSAATVHQFSLTYIFDIRPSFGDFVPVIAIGSLLALEMMRIYGKRFGAVEISVALVPLAAVLLTVTRGSFEEGLAPGVGLLWHPPVLLAVVAAAIAWLCLRNRWVKLRYVIIAYFLGIVLTVGVTPEPAGTLNWELSGYALAALLFFLGIILRNVAVALTGVLALSLTVMLSPTISSFADVHELPVLGIVGLVAGGGTVVAYLIFGTKLPRGIGLLGAAVLSLSTIACSEGTGGGAGPPYPAASGVLLVVLGGAVWLRSRDIPGALLLCVPLARTMYTDLKEMSGWHYVAISFALLAIATVISLTKGQGRGEERGPPC